MCDTYILVSMQTHTPSPPHPHTSMGALRRPLALLCKQNRTILLGAALPVAETHTPHDCKHHTYHIHKHIQVVYVRIYTNTTTPHHVQPRNTSTTLARPAPIADNGFLSIILVDVLAPHAEIRLVLTLQTTVLTPLVLLYSEMQNSFQKEAVKDIQ